MPASDGQQARYRHKLGDLGSALLAADQVPGVGSVEPVEQVQRSVDDPRADRVHVELPLRTFATGLPLTFSAPPVHGEPRETWRPCGGLSTISVRR